MNEELNQSTFGSLSRVASAMLCEQKGRRRRRNVFRATIAAAVFALTTMHGIAAASADVELWRLDCGAFPDWSIEQMSDTFDYSGKIKTLVNSCYLIRHGRDYMLWDTGLSAAGADQFNKAGLKTTLGETLRDQLSRISVDPKQISIVGISHFHPDHTGQAPQFPQARLLMGKADFELLAEAKSTDIAPWLAEGANLEKVLGDKDVFGDGSVVMLATPGHTMGHHSLLIRLSKFGAVILSGDLWHFSEQVNHNGMPPPVPGVTDRADELASMDRVLKAATNLKAKIIIQHEMADVSKLPKFPSSAR
jgi:N-acyl homoserine lactone hydrolase